MLLEKTPIPKYNLRYSEIKPIARYARDHWSKVGEHTPFRGFEDHSPNIARQLRACRRQVFNAGLYLVHKKRYSPEGAVTKMNQSYFRQ